MEQVIDLGDGQWSGAKGSDLVDGYELAIEAWGEGATYEDGGLTAFAYLWRRFGPPWRGSDDHKDLVGYYLTTSDPKILLWVSLSGSPLSYAIGYLAERSITDAYYQPMAEWEEKFKDWLWDQHPELHDIEGYQEKADQWTRIYWSERVNSEVLEAAKKAAGPIPKRCSPNEWREDDGVLNHVNQVLFDALKELERPVYIRDVAINIFGRCDGCDDPVEQSCYAGYGIPKEPMDAYLTQEESPHD